MPLINALSIDDDAAFQRQLRLLLLADDIRLLPSASEMEQGLYFAASMKPDVVLLDIWVGGRNQLDQIPRLKEECPGVKIVVLSLHQEPEYAAHAVKQGADGYVSKSDAAESLVDTVLRVVTTRSPEDAT